MPACGVWTAECFTGTLLLVYRDLSLGRLYDPREHTCTSPASSTDSSWNTGPCCESDCSCCTAGESSMSNWKVSGERMKSAAACYTKIPESHHAQMLS